MATKKKTVKVSAETTPKPEPAPEPVEQEPVENQSGHRHVYERVNGLGTGETIDFCAICADVKKV